MRNDFPSPLRFFVVEKNMREIVLDTETTGMDPFEGDRIVEIGCVELENHLPTGNHYHVYINPERDVPAEVVAVHGLTEEFLKDKPVFAEVYPDFLEFIGDAKLVIHNAAFDMKFINHHLTEMGTAAIPSPRVIDSLNFRGHLHHWMRCANGFMLIILPVHCMVHYWILKFWPRCI